MPIRTIPALLVVLIVCSATAYAQSGNSIRGKIRTDQGQPAVQVIVTIESGSGTPINQTVTNNEGDFFFGGLEGSTYILTVKEPHYLPISEHVDFVTLPGPENPGEQRFVALSLTPEPGSPLSHPAVVFAQDVPQAARDAFNRGMQLSKEHKDQEAIAAFKEAIGAFANYFDAHFALANELYGTNNLSEAIQELERARQINPKDDRVFASFGLVLSKAKKYSVAAAAFGEAARMKPGEPQYPLMRAAALIDMAGQLDAAKTEQAKERDTLLTAADTDLSRAYDLSGKKLTSVHLQRARLYERKGDPKRAADMLELYLKQTPNVTNAAAIRDSIAKLRSGK